MPPACCQLPGCNLPCYVDSNGRVHDYCNRTHANQALAMQMSALSLSTSTQGQQLCINCNSKQVHTDQNGPSQFCTIHCRDTYRRKSIFVAPVTNISPSTSVSPNTSTSPPSNTSGASVVTLSSSDTKAQEIQKQFVTKWLHKNKAAPTQFVICAIRCSSTLYQSFKTYQQNIASNPKLPKDGNTRRRFHGTRQICTLGLNNQTTPCSDSNCAVCGIISTGWKLTFNNSNAKYSGLGRFGKALYFTSASSKADDYTGMALQKTTPNLKSKTGYHCMLVAQVVCGNAHKPSTDLPNLTQVPSGYDSVVGENGVHTNLNYDEVAVYNEAACIPSYLILYK